MPSAPSSSVTASAPGRVNLIGEHTDYNDGFVLPMPIPQQTTVHLRPVAGKQVLLASEGEAGTASYQLGEERKTGTWIDYVQGVTRALAQRGYAIGGFEARISSAVPIGAGLSSSAALEVSMLRALRQCYGLALDDLTIAKLGQVAEVELVGVPTGIMDQMASSLGRQGSALLIDTRSFEARSVALPEQVEPVVIASGVTHAHDTGGYRVRRAECTQACTALGLATLRDATDEHLARAEALAPNLRGRVRHVFTENARVLQTVEALASADLPALGRLFAASHASMRDDYEVSVPEIDLLVELGANHADVVAARLTGGGFGGSVVMLAARGRGLAAARQIVEQYDRRTQLSASILLPLGAAPAD
jgi:galactokinase